VSATVPRDVPDEEIAGIRDIDFPIGMRGYDRAAVDAYVMRVNRIIAELQVSRSPQSAIRNALDQVSEETRGILERAHEAADEIASRSRSQADDRIQAADREAQALLADAEARVRQLDADADAVRRERNRLIEDVRHLAAEMQVLAEQASSRFPALPGEPEADTVAIVPPPIEEEDEDEERPPEPAIPPDRLGDVEAAGSDPADEPAPPPPPPPPSDREPAS
jgi:DivIVA domain-containing protein